MSGRPAALHECGVEMNTCFRSVVLLVPLVFVMGCPQDKLAAGDVGCRNGSDCSTGRCVRGVCVVPGTAPEDCAATDDALAPKPRGASPWCAQRPTLRRTPLGPSRRC